METLVASGHLRRLRDHGILEQKGKGSGTYYVPGYRFLESLQIGPSKVVGEEQKFNHLENGIVQNQQQPGSLSGGFDSLSRGFDSLSGGFDSLSTELPKQLKQQIEKLGKRTAAEQLDETVEALCVWREWSLQQLEALTGRSAKHLLRGSIQRLMNQHRLHYTIPDNPSHPQQKYTALKSLQNTGATR